jgi:hypothetical protein
LSYPTEGIENLTELQVLALEGNTILDLADVNLLASLKKLSLLSFQSKVAKTNSKHTNPICLIANYREKVLLTVPQLKMLDGQVVGTENPEPDIMDRTVVEEVVVKPVDSTWDALSEKIRSAKMQLEANAISVNNTEYVDLEAVARKALVDAGLAISSLSKASLKITKST